MGNLDVLMFRFNVNLFGSNTVHGCSFMVATAIVVIGMNGSERCELQRGVFASFELAVFVQ